MKNQLKIVIGMLFILLILSCQKGEYINQSQAFTTFKINKLGQGSFALKSIVYNNVEYNASNYSVLAPYVEEDSTMLVIKYNIDNKDYEVSEKIAIKAGQNNMTVYLETPESTVLKFGDNPLGDINPPEGKILLKIFNKNKILSPNGDPIHLAFYNVEGGFDSNNPNYTEIPTDTLFNIGTEIPKDFQEFKRLNYGSGGFWKAKVLNKDKSELQIDGKKVYLFLGLPPNINVFIIYGNDSDIYFDTWDQNSYMPLPEENAVSSMSPFNIYMSR